MTQLIRTTVICLMLTGGALFGYWHLFSSEKDRQIAELERMNEEMEARIAEREQMLDRLARTHRLAHVIVGEQTLDESGEVLSTPITFIELDEDGSELARQEMTLPGDVIFFDAWTVKFDFEDVAHGHPLLGRTLVLLKRVYSDQLAPRDGISIDTPGAVPPGYAASDIGRFEKQLWDQFWQIASNAALARAMGVRVAQGEVVYKKMEQGQEYRLIVDASGGMNLIPLTGELPPNGPVIDPRSGRLSLANDGPAE